MHGGEERRCGGTDVSNAIIISSILLLICSLRGFSNRHRQMVIMAM